MSDREALRDAVAKAMSASDGMYVEPQGWHYEYADAALAAIPAAFGLDAADCVAAAGVLSAFERCGEDERAADLLRALAEGAS
jgi:hypothetical protein